MNFLPGWFPGVRPVAAPSSLTFVASATGDFNTVTIPASTQAGDLILMWQVYAGGPTVAGPPTGFTLIDQFLSSDFGSQLSYRIAQPGDASSAVNGVGSGSVEAMLMHVFRPNAPISAVTPGGIVETASDSNPASQVIGSGSGAVPLVVLGGYHSNGAIDPRTFTPAKDGEINTTDAGDQWLAYKIYNSSPADVTIDMDDEGLDNTLHGCYVSVS